MFSVVIPLYNKELSIKNTIQSVLDQTYQDFEIVVVNDGSSDSSAAVVEAIEDHRIRLIKQKNQGVSAARNRGIQEAGNEWVAFLDGDDLWEKGHLQEISLMMQKFPNEKVFVTSFEYSDKRPMFRHPRSEPIFKVENYFKEAMKESLMWTSIVVVHKSCIEVVGGFNEELNRGEDLDLWARLARQYQVVKSGKVTAVYNISDGASLSKGKSDYERSILSKINLRGLKSFERKYFKRMIVNRLKLDVKTLDFKEIFILLVKHNIEIFIR
ncbi:glycosyltransferase family 2 protein [Idiomarina sp.]|uniref:glycosyltransferase family 2 protein n=1 Tax=Idiomarina sp. TaxID=1874361 RepID=UPI00351417B2